ncbi:acylphosphatase [Bifidobacterium aquikefiri]|uniref:acylphosphatase n=1 Tax=Bifidobacterium aquikefiri TaxID=1653207 RepID=A0A261G9G3_9BIFI|nr:acylphosphatase [Bifidobacterium aquikefiri]OZG67835.1 acylphosphatase [Bifidobacterium aquikefiri]
MKVEERLLSGLRSHGRKHGGVMDVKPQSIRIHAQVIGMVQGVGFRYAALRVAERIQVTGWVHNEHDGSVVVEAQGDEEAISSMTQWLHEGPAWARVDNVNIEHINPVPERRFIIR